MKAKVVRGSGFRGVLDYGLDESKNAEIVGGNMAGSTPKELAAEFAVSRNMRTEVSKPVMHFSLSLPVGEDVSSQKWRDVIDAFMKEMGLDQHQFVGIKHNDTDHKHVHIIASRIGLDGSLWHGKFEVFRAIEATQKLEKEFGLTVTPGLDSIDAENHKKNLTKSEMEQSIRAGEAPVRQLLQNIIDDAVQGNPSVTAFVERLESAGVTVKPNVASTGKLNGFGFSLNGIAFKGSDLGKAYAWKGLQQKGVTYDQEQERGELIRRKVETISAESPDRAPDPGSNPGLVDESVDTERRESVDGQSPSEANRSDRENSQGIDHRIDEQGVTERLSPEQSRIEAGDGSEPNTPDSDDRSQSDRLHAWSRLAADVADLAATADPAPVADVTNPVTKALQSKMDAWERQSGGLGAPEYRIILKGRRDGLPTYNAGKQKDGTERFFTQAQVTSMLPKLSRENARGFDVYVTPVDPEHHYIVVDDMRADTMKQFLADGFKPCLVQESSHDNWQSIIKIPKVYGEQSPANTLVSDLNRVYGDPNFSGVVHPFRLAGFSNKKPGKGDPFTKVREAVNRICDKAAGMFQAIKDRLEKASQKTIERYDRERQILVAHSAKGTPRDALDAFRRAYARNTGLAESQGWVVDASRVDWASTIDMLKAGYSPGETANAMLAASPEILDRHNDPKDYAERTVSNALSEPEVVSSMKKRAEAKLLDAMLKPEDKQTKNQSAGTDFSM